jgi:CDP-4-dehydro-6-deoxyglucose reductase
MTFRIRIQPSGHSFLSEGRSTLLEAGLRAGLALDYGCSNGNCGQCLARIVSGEVKKVRHHDFALSERQHLENYVLMCSQTALSDVVLEATEAGGGDEFPQQNVPARIRNLDIVNGNVALLHLKTPRNDRLRFLAGQKVSLRSAGGLHAEHFISSCPCDDMHLHFQVPKKAGDAFSGYLFNSAKKGDLIDIEGPFGEFTLRENSSNELVFVALWTGFGPIRSLVEQAMALELPQAINLLWMTRSPLDRYQHNLCRSWQDVFDNFNYQAWNLDKETGTIDQATIFKRLGITPAEPGCIDFYLADSQGASTRTTGSLSIEQAFLRCGP